MRKERFRSPRACQEREASQRGLHGDSYEEIHASFRATRCHPTSFHEITSQLVTNLSLGNRCQTMWPTHSSLLSGPHLSNRIFQRHSRIYASYSAGSHRAAPALSFAEISENSSAFISQSRTVGHTKDIQTSEDILFCEGQKAQKEIRFHS